MITAFRQGSLSLTGAAPLEYRIPAGGHAFGSLNGCSSMVEQQLAELWVAGSNPAIPERF